MFQAAYLLYSLTRMCRIVLDVIFGPPKNFGLVPLCHRCSEVYGFLIHNQNSCRTARQWRVIKVFQTISTTRCRSKITMYVYNLALIGEGVGIRALKIQNFVKLHRSP